MNFIRELSLHYDVFFIDHVLQETYSMYILFKHTFFSILKEALM